MKQKPNSLTEHLRHIIRQKGYLLLLSAWLFTLAFLTNHYWTYNASIEKVAKRLENNIREKEQDFENLASNGIVLQLLGSQAFDEAKIAFTQKSYGLFLFSYNDRNNPILHYWNTQQFAPLSAHLTAVDTTQLVSYTNGSYVLKKRKIILNGKQWLLVGLIPVKWHFFIENKYLQTNFAEFPGLTKQYDLSFQSSQGIPVNGINGKKLFQLEKKSNYVNNSYDWITIFLGLSSILVFCYFLQITALYLCSQLGFNTGFGFLVLLTFLFRLIIYRFPFPFDEGRLPIFDPSIYASNFLHPSLGDLFMNALLHLWLVGFYYFVAHKYYSAPALKGIHKYSRLVLLTILTLWMVDIVKSILQDGKISLQVTDIFTLNWYSFLCCILFGVLALSYYYLSHILLASFQLKNDYWKIFVTTAIGGLTYFTVSSYFHRIDGYQYVLIWFLLYVYFVLLRKTDAFKPIIKSKIFIFWVMLYAVSIAMWIMYQSNLVEIEQRKKIAERLAEQNDPTGENLLSLAIAGLDEQQLADNFYRFQSEFSNKYVKDSIVSDIFGGYLNKYEAIIYTYNQNQEPLYNDDSTAYKSLVALTQLPTHSLHSTGFISFQLPDNHTAYLYNKLITQNSDTVGYFCVYIKAKPYKSEALYPELFKQTDDALLDYSKGYAYAIYNNGQLINKINDYAFPYQLNKKQLNQFKYNITINKGYSSLLYNSGNGKMVLVVKAVNNWLFAATLFAYLFAILLAFIFLLHSLSFVFSFNWLSKSFKINWFPTIKTQIHATILFISLFSFIVIGVATVSFFYNRFNNSSQEKLSKIIQMVANEVQVQTQEIQTALSFDDGLTITDVPYLNALEAKISEISELHHVDINLYSPAGNLLSSTQPFIYYKNLLSEKMNPIAFVELSSGKANNFVHTEHIGSLQYLSMYIPILDNSGAIFTYLNIPYLNSQAELNQEISGFLATLINLNAFIFLLAAAIAFIITNRIVDSFTVIANKMKEVNIGSKIEPLVWNKNDEIGLLVNEYNKMVEKLALSAASLAKSEREGAWREMARQVAHEIKNPLTPMKLSIQYLENAMRNNSPNAQALALKMSGNLIEQIDQLAKIAGDFSQFANIAQMQPEKLSLNQSLLSVIQLHQHQDLQIHWLEKEKEAFVWADKIQLSRLFTNLIKNACEVERLPNVLPTIEVKLLKEDRFYAVSITDNGVGITNEQLPRIFSPNFTTKTSGTGLGLAICKGIVEKHNGDIQFVSQPGIGTTFTVFLPVYFQ